MFDIESDHCVSGEAVDQETILRQRPEIEEYVKKTIGEFARTELYWNLKEEGVGDSPFVFELHFYKDEPASNN